MTAIAHHIYRTSLEKLGYKSQRRLNEIEIFKKSGLCSKEKFKEVDEFAGHAFSYLWERVQASIIQESLPGEQLPDEPTESDQAEPQTGSSHQEVTVPTARTASSAENWIGQSIIQPALNEVYVSLDTSPPLQFNSKGQLNGAIPDQLEGYVWPLMQRIPGYSNSGTVDMQSAGDPQIPAGECAVFNNAGNSPGQANRQSMVSVSHSGYYEEIASPADTCSYIPAPIAPTPRPGAIVQEGILVESQGESTCHHGIDETSQLHPSFSQHENVQTTLSPHSFDLHNGQADVGACGMGSMGHWVLRDK